VELHQKSSSMVEKQRELANLDIRGQLAWIGCITFQLEPSRRCKSFTNVKNRHNGPGHIMMVTQVAMLPVPIPATAAKNSIPIIGKTLMIIVNFLKKTKLDGFSMPGSRKGPLT
jgi:hypothetical protein